MRRLPYCRTPRRTRNHPHGSAPRKDMDRVAEPCSRERRRSPAALCVLPSPRSGPRPPRLSGAPGKRTIAPRVRREAIDGWRYSSDKSRRTRSGSRPKIMVARFVTPDRDLPRRPFVSSEVRSVIRDRRLEWPPVRRVLRDTNLTAHLAPKEWAGGPVNARSMVGGVHAPFAGPPYRVSDALQRRARRALPTGSEVARDPLVSDPR
jgi:hypothetical protein